MSFIPYQDAGRRIMVGTSDVAVSPLHPTMHVVLIGNMGASHVLFGIGASPNENDGILIPAGSAAEYRIPSTMLYFRRVAGSLPAEVLITAGEQS